MNPWHSIHWPLDASVLPAVITVSKDTSVRYVLDEESGLLRVAALLPEGTRYPGNLGVLPRTATAENTPLETLVLGERPLQPLSLTRVRPIGMFKCLARGVVDLRLVSVHYEDREMSEYETLVEYPQYRVAQLKSFLEDEMKFSGWEGEVTGIAGREEARVLVRECRMRYEETIGRDGQRDGSKR